MCPSRQAWTHWRLSYDAIRHVYVATMCIWWPPFLNWRAQSDQCPHLYVDLNWLPLSTLGVCHSFCVILARVDHWLWVFGLLFQGEGDPTHAHRPAPKMHSWFGNKQSNSNTLTTQCWATSVSWTCPKSVTQPVTYFHFTSSGVSIFTHWQGESNPYLELLWITLKAQEDGVLICSGFDLGPIRIYAAFTSS